MDGWWREGYKGENGWKIGNDHHESDREKQDDYDFESLIQVLSESVIPEFYNRDEHGIPLAWLKRIRNAMQTLLSQFSTDRMVGEYVQKCYIGDTH